jgi:hypothetical protein
VQVEFEATIYHVMARGDQEAIGREEADREMFVRTLVKPAREWSGFRIDRAVLMSSHYHPQVETPSQSFARDGMAAERLHAPHEQAAPLSWEHLFGERYKAILVEPGNWFGALRGCIQLNPVRTE